MRFFENKKCLYCGTVFKPTNQKQKHCSTICKITSHATEDSNGCLNWNGFKNNKGYGHITWKGELSLTHRLICESAHGLAPTDKPMALHSCDNPSCCNPDHLRWGTNQENMDDKKERNRLSKGDTNGKSKLTEKEVIEIINKLKNYKRGDYTRLGKEYNIDNSEISRIHKNKIWKHISR